MNRLIPLIFAIALVCLISNAQAVDVTGAVGDYTSGSFDYTFTKTGYFFVEDDAWENNIWFSATPDKIYYTVKIPSVSVGSYTVPIKYKRAYKESCTVWNVTKDCYAEETVDVDSFSVTVTETVAEIREVPLPKSGLLQINQMLTSEAGFSISVSEIGAESAIINMVNCNEVSRNIAYEDNATFTCGSCTVVVKPDYRFLDSVGTEHIKLRLYSDCFNYLMTLSGEGIDTPSDCEIDIQIIGNAIRGQALTILTKNKETGKSIRANVIMTDSSIYTEDQLFVTSQPWEGVGKASFDVASEAPVTILARNEELDCEGQYIINTLSGELILPNATNGDEPEDLPVLEIKDMVEEVYEDTCFTGKVYADDSIVTNDDVSGDVVRIKKPEADEYTLKTKINDSDVFSVCVGSKMGKWTLKASFEGYEDSDEYIVTVREPREKVIVLAKLNYGTYYMPPEQIPPIVPGTALLIILSDEDNFTVEENIEIEVEFAGEKTTMGLTGGFGMYTPPKDKLGEIIFRIPQSDKYEAWSSGPVMVVEGAGFDWVWEYLMYGGVAFVIIVLVIFGIRRKRKGGGRGKGLAWNPGASDASPGPMEEEFDISD